MVTSVRLASLGAKTYLRDMDKWQATELLHASWQREPRQVDLTNTADSQDYHYEEAR